MHSKKSSGLLGLILISGILVVSCKKKEQAVAPTPNEPVTSGQAAASPEAPVPLTQPPEPIVTSSDANQVLSSAQAALKQKDYEKAAATLLYVQQQRLNDQQADAARAQMVQLQKDLVGAIGAGDPKAKAAADLLRASHSHR
jgi:hypothetical protein